ncbi:MAG: M20/M25/M40 family metallo-hydrolase, partial [Methanomicrobiales archaeon]|nr:M20/M25/M40 family metallo-hydrolase [Methanomicrobiales archaeon]
MVDIKILKEKAKHEVDAIMPRLIEMSDWIGKNPELGSEEVDASKLLAVELDKHGFKVEMGVLGMPTAFKAIKKGRGKGPKIAFLCEYDALPGVGHGCGHNMIGTSGLGAGIAVAKLMRGLPGEVWVVGTPAEEGHGPSSGAKKRMAEAGVFKGVEAVMMMHPIGNS